MTTQKPKQNNQELIIELQRKIKELEKRIKWLEDHIIGNSHV